MHALVTAVPSLPLLRQPGTWGHPLDPYRDRPGFVAGHLLRPFVGSAATIVTLWADESAALAAPVPPAAGATGTYDVYATDLGPEADTGPPRVAQLTWFDGPRSAALIAAMERAAPRMSAATAGLPGHVATYACRAADGGEVILTLTTSVETLEEGGRRVTTAELGPDEDPALLTGPDRIDVCRVEAPVAATTGVGGAR